MGFEHGLIWLGVWWGGLGWGGLSLQAYGLFKLVVAQVQKNPLLSQLFWSLNSLNRHNVSVGVRAGGRGGLQSPQILGNSDFLGTKRKFGQSQLSKTFSCFFISILKR